MELVVPDAVILPVRLCLLCKETVGGLPEVALDRRPSGTSSFASWCCCFVFARGPFVAPYVARIVKVRRSHPPSKIFYGFKVNEVLARRDVGRGPGDREIFLN